MPFCDRVPNVPHAQNAPRHCLCHRNAQSVQCKTQAHMYIGQQPNEYSGTSKPSRTWNSDSMEQSFPWTWISMATPILAGLRIQTTPAPPPVLYLLATVGPFPGLVNYKAWSHFPLQSQSTLDLAIQATPHLALVFLQGDQIFTEGLHRVILW